MKIRTEHVFNINVTGSRYSGKSSLILKYADGTFTESYINTIECKQIELDVNINTVNLILWDNQSDHSDRFFHGMNATIITVDMTEEKSFQEASVLITKVRSESPHTAVFIVGTKCDLHNELKVTPDQLSTLNNTSNNVYSLGPVSAKKSQGIYGAFNTIICSLIDLSIKADQNQHTTLKSALDEYTSVWNQMVAGFKYIVTFGQFSLGVKKQALAEMLKQELNNNVKIDIHKFERKNKSLVEKEFQSSCLFGGRYVKFHNEKLEYNEGELGKILKNDLK